MLNHFSLVAAATTLSLAASLAAQSLSPVPTTKPAVNAKTARTVKGARERQRLARPTFATTRGSGVVGPLAVTEVERNDTLGYADVLAGQPDYDGDIAVAGDIDWVRYDVNTSGVVTFDVSPLGASPIADATLTLVDAQGQFVAFNDDRPATLYPLLVLPLQAGTYYAGIEGFGGTTTGGYKLTVTNAPTSFPPATLNGSTSGNVPSNGETSYLLLLNQPSAVRLGITANGGMDMYCALQRPSGAVHRFVDDGVTGSPDPSLDVHLPSGVYMLTFGDFNGVGGAFTFNTTVTAAPVPALACGATVNGTVAGTEGQNLYSMVLVADSNVNLSVAFSGTPLMTDSILYVYDRDLNTITYNDDNNNVLSSLVTLSLPSGQYYVGVESFGNTSAGAYSLTNTCVAFASTTGRFGRNSGTLAGADHLAFAVDLGTPTPVEMLCVIPPVLFPMTSILDESGACLGFSDFGEFQRIGHRASGSRGFFTVRDFFNQAGTFDVDIESSMFFQGATKGTLTMQDKAGQVHFPFAAVGTFAGFPVPAPFTGNLVIAPPLISLPALPIPANGVTSYPATFPNGAYLLQALSLTPSPLGGAMTNVAR